MTMSLITMDTMSSLLREANDSLMAGNTLSNSKNEEIRFHEDNLSQSSSQPDVNQEPSPFSSNQLSFYNNTFSPGRYQVYEPVTQKLEGLEGSLNSAKSQRLRRPHSSPPERAADSVYSPAALHTDSDIDVYSGMENFPMLYTSIASLIASETGTMSPASDDVQMDVGASCSRYDSSRSSTPSSRVSAIDKLPFSSGELFSRSKYENDDDFQFEGQFKTDGHHDTSTNFNTFNTSDYTGQEGQVPALKFSDQHLEKAYHSSSSPLHGGYPQNGQLTTATHQKRDFDMQDVHSVSNSLDSYDILADTKYEDSDYSNASTDHYTGRCSSALPRHIQQHHSNSGDIVKYNYRQSASTPASSLPSPSSSSQAGDDNTQTSMSDVNFKDIDSSQQGQGYTSDVNDAKVKGKDGIKPRGAQNLPPCRVCGNMASGLHFGVNTCEACNEFFRRSLKRGATYYCSKNRECQVYGKKRNACSFCRYQRCVEMGMSRDAIKTGRYSHKTRTEYAMEVEKCKMKEVNRAETVRYEILLSDLVKYHDKYVKVTTRVPEEDLLLKQTDYLQLYHTQRQHERRHPPLKTAVQNKRLLDDWTMAKEDLSLTMHDAEMTEQWLRNYINFAKNVPGFKELALSDQASLVRGSWFEFWFLGAFRGYNSSLQVVIYPNGRCFHKEEIKKVFGQEYTDFSFYLADRMRSLHVTPEVMVLIKTVCLTFPDRTTLDNKEAVDKMHWLLVSCLLHTLEKNKLDGAAVFPLVVSKLVELRTLTDIAMRAHKSALFQDVLKDSPLLCEMVDTKTRYVQCMQKNAIPAKGQS